VSNNKKLGMIYEQVYQKLKARSNNVLTLERGRLYGIISEILGESNFESRKERTKAICNELNINSNSFLNDDFQIVEQLLSEVFTERQVSFKIVPRSVKNFASQVIVGFNNHVSSNSEEDSMKWLVVAACMLVGVYACLQYLRRTEQEQGRRSSAPPQPSTPEVKTPPIPAELCLVVPASEVSDLIHSPDLKGDRLKELVNSASYFLCSSSKEKIENIEKNLDSTNEIIPVDSLKDVYIRISIEDGREMIDKTIRYEIKTNLKDSQTYQIKKLNCLRTLSGLESFIRI
jgi:hypothetical protein